MSTKIFPSENFCYFICGKNSSQSIKQASRQNGSENINLYDSISDSSKETRKDFNFSYGFNQKKYIFLGKYSHVSLKDYSDVYKLENFSFSKYSLKTPYGLTLNEHVKLKVWNHNRYNAINFNLHIVCLSNAKLTMEELAKGTFNVTSTLQDQGAIPSVYQYSDMNSNKTRTEVFCNVTTSLLSSSFFKNNCKIVKSFKKRLNPGDIYEFIYKYRCGSGVRLDLLYERMNSIKSSDQPSTYGFIIETLGYDCEAIDLEDESLRYVGKSPGFFNIEIRKDLEVCTKSQTVSNNDNFDFNSNDKDYLIRVFTKNLKTEKDFNFDHGDLDKKYKIITYSVQNIRSAGETHFNSSNHFINSNKNVSTKEEKKLINIDDLEESNYDIEE